MAKTALQNDKMKEKVAKLCCAVSESYQILRNTSHSTYFIKRLYKPDSPKN